MADVASEIADQALSRAHLTPLTVFGPDAARDVLLAVARWAAAEGYQRGLAER